MGRSTRQCAADGQHLLACLREVLGYGNGNRQAGRVAMKVLGGVPR